MNIEKIEDIKKILLERGVNPQLLIHPGSSLLHNISQFVVSNKPCDEYKLMSVIQVDEEGNLTFCEKVETIVNDEPSLFASKEEYKILEDGGFSYEVMSKSNGFEKINGIPMDMVCYNSQKHVYDEFGIELERTFAIHNRDIRRANPNLVEQEVRDKIRDSEFFSVDRIKHENVKMVETIKRNMDIGSASIDCDVNLPNGNSFIGALGKVRLSGEKIQNLDFDPFVNDALLQLLNSQTQHDLINKRDAEPALNFEVYKLETDEKDEYYDWLASEVELVSNEDTREALRSMINERKLISSDKLSQMSEDDISIGEPTSRGL